MNLSEYSEEYREQFPDIICDIDGCNNISAAYDKDSNYVSLICATCCKDPSRNILCPYCHAKAYLLYHYDDEYHFIDCKACASIYIVSINLEDHPF